MLAAPPLLRLWKTKYSRGNLPLPFLKFPLSLSFQPWSGNLLELMRVLKTQTSLTSRNTWPTKQTILSLLNHERDRRVKEDQRNQPLDDYAIPFVEIQRWQPKEQPQFENEETNQDFLNETVSSARSRSSWTTVSMLKFLERSPELINAQSQSEEQKSLTSTHRWSLKTMLRSCYDLPQRFLIILKKCLYMLSIWPENLILERGN